MSNNKNFLTAEEAKQISYTTDKALARVFKQIKLEAEDGNNFTDIDMLRLSTQAKARICDELVNAGYKTLPLCEFHGTGAHGVRVYWENVGIRDYNLDEEYFINNMLNAEIARSHAEDCAESFYLKEIMYQIKCASDIGSMHVNYKLHEIATSKDVIEKITTLLNEKGFNIKQSGEVLVISW